MDPKTINTIPYLPSAQSERRPTHLPSSAAQEEGAKPVAELLLASPSLSQHHNPDTQHPLSMPQNHPEPVLEPFTAANPTS